LEEELVSFLLQVAAPDHELRSAFTRGLEEELVSFLLQVAAPDHELRSAFTRGLIRSWVYIEATMNEHLHAVLKSAPGVVLKRAGIICQGIDFADWLNMLTMGPQLDTEDIGKWVHVRKGTYKGDVGYVNSVEDWGVSLFLVPRLPPSQLTLKRKRSLAHPPPALFEPDVMHELDGVCPAPVDLFEGHRFEYGLILKSYDFNSILTSVSCIPNCLFTLFRWSRHPKVLEAESTFPWPSDWLFSEGDKVIVLPSRK
jgi:hypothetical protein